MRILFDKSAPYGLARHLKEHVIATTEERGWGRLENGVLLSKAEEAGFESSLGKTRIFATSRTSQAGG